MCKVLVTCYITLMLVTVANGKPLLLRKSIDYAIEDVIKLKEMNLRAVNDYFYTPEDFTNEEQRMEALAVYMAEMKVLEVEVKANDQNVTYIDNILRNLSSFVNITKPKCSDCPQKNAQEFLEGLQNLLQSIRKPLSHTVESN